VSHPCWTGSRNALWVLARCWELGLRPPAGRYILTPQVGQAGALNLTGAAKSPLYVEHEDYRTWGVESHVGMATLRRYHEGGNLQATLRLHPGKNHGIGHWMTGFEGVPLLPSDAFIWRMTCPWCGEKITRKPMPQHEYDRVDPLPYHHEPACDRWNGRLV